MKQETIDKLEATVEENDNPKQRVDAQDEIISRLDKKLFETEFHHITKN